MASIAGTLVLSLIETGLTEASHGEEVNLVGSAVNVLGSLIVILAILVVGLYWGKRFVKTDQLVLHKKAVRVLGSTYLGMKKSISLVQVPGSILVLGLSNENITLLSKIENEAMEELVKLNEQKEKEPVRPAWSNRIGVFPFPPGNSQTVMAPPVMSFVKGKILDFKKFQQLRLRTMIRLHPVPCGKDDYE